MDNKLNTDKELNHEKEKSEDEVKLLDHDYDGIKELDNSLPPWWIILFYLTVVFSFLYGVLFLGIGLFDQNEELKAEYDQAEMELVAYQEAQEKAAKENKTAKPVVQIDEDTVVVATSETAISDGKTIYTANCAACHRVDGGGGIGPNLTDSYWLHGSEFRDVFKLITHGVPEKGMISWKTQLKPEQIQNVASYVYTLLKDKNVADGKAPEGVEE